MSSWNFKFQLESNSNIIYKVNIISELEPHTYSVVTNTCISNICYLKYFFSCSILPKLNLLPLGFVLLLAILGDFGDVFSVLIPVVLMNINASL